MPRWLEVTLTIALFTMLMGIASIVVNATVPTVHAWLIDHIGQAGFWAFFVALWITGGVLLYREKAGKAGKAVGR
ncbi:hypothetical protein MKK69_12885 [Methylobacterium sp. J-026]|uniref:hypothetical protein n=1 Tax=Methylobacterium sp. J-026 TaxID=2836624 RepID=UPI001FBB8ECE|nr:hypothetical protein [Methylobacterium sp. J-026]MCJ2134947.1 hypothetical protein [Methylobacterium sp. J-026]